MSTTDIDTVYIIDTNNPYTNDRLEDIRIRIGIQLGIEYVNAFHLFYNRHLLSKEEKKVVAQNEYDKDAWIATLKYRDYLASNAFGGNRRGKNKAELLADLEKTRKYYENIMGVRLVKNKGACTEEWYNAVWADIDEKARQDRERNRSKTNGIDPK